MFYVWFVFGDKIIEGLWVFVVSLDFMIVSDMVVVINVDQLVLVYRG